MTTTFMLAACTLSKLGQSSPPARLGALDITGSLVAHGRNGDVELAGANVYLADARGVHIDAAATRLDGSFQLTAPRAGAYAICYGIGRIHGCGPASPMDRRNAGVGPIAIAPTPFLSGRVLTGDGRPCWMADSFFGLDVKTQVSAQPRGGLPGSRAASTIANTDGEYALFGLSDGDYDITARCEAAFTSGWTTVSGGWGTADFDFSNHAPVIRTAAVYDAAKASRKFLAGSNGDLSADVADQDGDTIEYLWRRLPPSGQITGNGTTVQWHMPASPGLATAYLIARDGKGGYAYQRIDVEVARNRFIEISGSVISETSGMGIDGAIVMVGSASTRTNERGWFSLSTPDREDDRYVLNVRQGDYALASQVFDGTARNVTLEMTPAQVSQIAPGARVEIVDRGSAGFCGASGDERPRQIVRRVRRESGGGDAARAARPAVEADACIRRGAQIGIPAGALVDAEGRVVTGPVRAAITTLNPTRRPLPGDYTAITRAGRIASLLSYGAVDARFTDSAGRPLNLRPGTTAEVRIPVPPSQESSARATLPMWSYDAERGRWIEEGQAVLERTGEGLSYVGQTRHFSTINIDFPGWDQTNYTNITCLRVKVDPGAWAAWSNKTLRVYFTQNGSVSQTQDQLLNNDLYHAIYTIPWHTGGVANTVRLELRGTTQSNIVQVLLDKVINTDALPQMALTSPNPVKAFPSYPYVECPDEELIPPAALVPYYGTDAGGRNSFLTGPYGTFNPANPDTAQYYAHVAAGKATLGDWWQANGFDSAGGANGNSSYTNAAYTNFNDLGFGRDMHCLEPATGKVACYVTNYGLPDQSAANADAAKAHNVGQRGATVAMDYDSTLPQYEVRFYVYGGGVAGSPRIDFADLDGLGPKPVPFLCMVCHGGQYDASTHDVKFARFREFDLPSFLYPQGGTFDFGSVVGIPPGVLDDFADLNKMVRAAQPVLTGSHPTPIRALIDSWYPNGFTGPPQKPTLQTMPQAWSNSPYANYYHDVYAKSCRTCHVARDNGTFPYPFKVFDDPANIQSAAYTVCGIPIGSGPARHRVMPNAWVTYRNFWLDPARVSAFETLTNVNPSGSCGQ